MRSVDFRARALAVTLLLMVGIGVPALASPSTSADSSLSDRLVRALESERADIETAPQIFGGSAIQNPGWVASIIGDGAYYCTGSLIHPEWLLTAAHCADDGSSLTVRIGNDSWQAGTQRNVIRTVIHPTWDPSKPAGQSGVDLALLRLSQPLNDVSLPQLAANPTWPHFDQVLLAVGWGQTFTASPPASTLQGAAVIASSGSDGRYDPNYCNLLWIIGSDFDNFCYGASASWTCSGDSGGPLVGWRSPSLTSGPVDMVYGVTSFGPAAGCSEWNRWDAVSQRIGTHIDWIEATMAPPPTTTTTTVPRPTTTTTTVPSPQPPASPFEDVTWYHIFFGDIVWLAESGITRGCNPPSNTQFCPNQPVTRAQMATFLVRALDLQPAPTSAFTDIPADNPHRADITALAQAGVTKGCNPPTNSRFCPNQPVTRAQMATFLTRALDLPSAGTGNFQDVPVDNPHRADIASLANAGITRSCNPPANTQFCPNQPVTRAQMAAFLNRAVG